MRGIRGAITVEENSRPAILRATEELLEQIMELNQLAEKELVSILFTTTSDLDRVYPALAARQLGLVAVPLLCLQEMEVVDSLKMCIRVLVHINRDCRPAEIKNVYLKGARALRPDLISSHSEDSEGEMSK